jgi:hypothetical protein
MIIVSKFGTFWVVYCRDCAWQDAPASWQEAEHLRAAHVCAPEPVLRIKSIAANTVFVLKRAPR